MKLIFVLTIVLLAACAGRQATITARQEAIMQEMEQVKKQYYQKTDSLDSIKRTDTSAVKQQQIAEELVTAGTIKIKALLALQKEYDSLETVLMKK